ncbi:MAG: Gfo/Idh/MocA family oxidoreductase [Clostridia bacterium]|nr:Gfo/Idh/MocA family oxidoreductase [Clostridia bacterium]MBQ4157464.1 Gfo/Idh/MocA family oxidoreductase [Clostridia bacterium]
MIKVGICGFAHGHVFSYAGEWMNDPEKYNVIVTAAWDHDEKRLYESIQKFPGEIKAYTSLDEMLDSDIDAVVVSSETGYHADICVKAANKKKNIVLYKPMALNMKEADRIVNAVKENGVRLSMGWQMRNDPQNIRMREIAQDEELGKVLAFRRRHGLPTHVWDNFENTWHVNPKHNRDIFADDSAHPINMMLWMFGMPKTVMCELSTMLNEKIPNDNGVALFKYENGLIAEISCSFTTSASEITTEMYCEKGSVQQYFGDNPATRLKKPEGMCGLKWFKEGDSDWTDSGIETPASHGLRLRDQAGPLAEFLNGGKEVCTAEEGRDSLRLVLACYLSNELGQRVDVNDQRINDIE